MGRRKPVVRPYVRFGPPVDLSGPPVDLSGSYTIVGRPIEVAVDGRGFVEIGYIYNRSAGVDTGFAPFGGYPRAFEVWKHGSGSWDFYPTVAAAEAGARDFAAAFVAAGGGSTHITSPYELAQAGRCGSCGQSLPER